jgi:hypothetical protein
MNYGDIKAKITDYTHRADLSDRMDGFCASVTQALDRRFGLTTGPLIADSDTNIYLTSNDDLYLWGALAEYAAWAHDSEMFVGFNGRFMEAMNQMNINYNGDEWDNTVPCVDPYAEVV